jgi:hypothetical protein
MSQCFRCKKRESSERGFEVRLHWLTVSCNAWNRVLLLCSNCMGWFQNILHDAEENGIDGP